MDCGYPAHRPAVPHFGHDFRDLLNDLLVVGLVFEMGHSGPSRRVIAHGPDEQHDGTGLGGRDRGDDRRRIHRIG